MEFPFMPSGLCKELQGFSIDEALEFGIISQIRDKNGKFYFIENDNHYAIIQGYKVKCDFNSNFFSDEAKVIGKLLFSLDIKDGKEQFKLMLSPAIKFSSMPSGLRKELHSLSISEALENEIINDLGDETGNFTFFDEGVCYAIVQGYRVRCSKPLMESECKIDQVSEEIGRLSFFLYLGDDGKEHFRLVIPHGIQPGNVIL